MTFLSSYVRACLRVVPPADYEAFGALCEQYVSQLAQTNRAFTIAHYLGNEQALVRATLGLEVHPIIRALIQVLVSKGDLLLLGSVCAALARTIRCKLGVEQCVITSAHPVDEADRLVFENALSRAIGKRLEARWLIDDQLIAGIRVLGENFAWERSVARHLRQYHRITNRLRR